MERTSRGALQAAISLPPAVLEAISVRVAELLADRDRAPEGDGWIDAREAAGLHRMTARGGRDGIPCGRDAPGGRLWFKRSDLDSWRRENGR